MNATSNTSGQVYTHSHLPLNNTLREAAQVDWVLHIAEPTAGVDPVIDGYLNIALASGGGGGGQAEDVGGAGEGEGRDYKQYPFSASAAPCLLHTASGFVMWCMVQSVV